ncbi:hypothetical protein Sgou_60850 [Streptomyces gougerotii]|uniref:Uncharacterized protein n=1 Tax=Streptomyces gougerotii TaxID=53448 RepID=A0A8H9LT61_9ACTN|nr:hypothetical protein Srut_38540 [Streptomyces rutgersensis]GFH81415.1 hypothetical protein Sgou_60850 [Streptomyces gougerotii]GGU76236.1 hypothetical protein GCM10010227_33150 [Streptomyces gougerotii]
MPALDEWNHRPVRARGARLPRSGRARPADRDVSRAAPPALVTVQKPITNGTVATPRPAAARKPPTAEGRRPGHRPRQGRGPQSTGHGPPGAPTTKVNRGQG